MSDLSHVDESGAVRMVDVGGKPLSRRRAVARASVRMAPETAQRLGDLPKGDALATAQLAGIMAAKRTSDLIPLCHPLPLSVVDVSLQVVADVDHADRAGLVDMREVAHRRRMLLAWSRSASCAAIHSSRSCSRTRAVIA